MTTLDEKDYLAEPEQEKSNSQKILEHLQSYKELTSMGAIRLFQETRLAARIFELRKRGHKIVTVMRPNSKKKGHHAVYSLSRQIELDLGGDDGKA